MSYCHTTRFDLMHVTETGPALRPSARHSPFSKRSAHKRRAICARSVTLHNAPPRARTRELPRFRVTSLLTGNTAESNTEGYQ
jgi:hypothetical protein